MTEDELILAAFAESRADGLRPPPLLTVSEWADRERRLSPEASAEQGRWITARAEYQRGIMDAVSDPAIETVVVMSSAQVGKTEVINNIVGFHIDQDPSPILLLQPTLEMASTWSKDRLAPMLRDTPVLRGRVKDARARDSGNTILHKTFPGGHITMAGANSPASLASRPVRIVLCDEVDRYPPSAGSEGDPVNLARKRATTFWNRKIVLTSTPTIKGLSRIEAAYEESDMRRFYVPCPDCGEEQTLKWAQVKWEDPEDAHYCCEHCGTLWDDAQRWNAVSRGRWVAENEAQKVAGFYLNEIYSPWVRVSEMVYAFKEAKKYPELLKTWINTALGETWEDKGETVDSDNIVGRAEPYDADTLPDAVVLLTVGCDVQGDRLEAECVGWGADEESWGVEYKVFRGDPDQREIWQELDDWLKQTYTREDGRSLRIEAACIDSSYKTDRVYQFTGPRKGRRVWAVQGMAGQGRPVWPRKASRGKNTRAPVFMVGVDQAKETIYTRLREIAEPGPGYMHFPYDYDEEYYRQLTSETVRTRYTKGRPVREWHQTRERNEALDCRVYAYAAMLGRGVDLNRRANIETQPAQKPEAEQPTVQQQIMQSQKRKIQPRRAGGFVNGWK